MARRPAAGWVAASATMALLVFWIASLGGMEFRDAPLVLLGCSCLLIAGLSARTHPAHWSGGGPLALAALAFILAGVLLAGALSAVWSDSIRGGAKATGLLASAAIFFWAGRRFWRTGRRRRVS